MHLLKRIIALPAVLALAGCAGTMTAVVRGETTPVQFQYEQGVDRDFYTAMLDGETFKGHAIDAGATSSVGNVFTGDGSGTIFTSTSSGNFVAVMLGDRGSSMRCQMNYADSSGFTSLGGVGICQVSDGRIIDVTW